VKKVILFTFLLVFALSACDALPGGGSQQVTPPASAGIAEVGYLSKVIFDLPNAIAGDYRAVVSGVEFSCRTYEDYPDQLFCFGPELPKGEHQAQIFLGDDETPLFTLTVTVIGTEVVITATPMPATPTSPPPPTSTPEPTATATQQLPTDQAGSATLTSAPPTPAAQVSATLSPDEAVKVFYFKLDEVGRYGCGEEMYWVKSTQPITSNTANNISYGLRMLFSYHQPYFGELYNPYGNADNQFAVGSIVLKDEGVAEVYLTGTYTRGEDPCDPTRLKDQILRIVTQFSDVTKAFVYLNGVRIEDAFQRK
jgi:hypothetical protein